MDIVKSSDTPENCSACTTEQRLAKIKALGQIADLRDRRILLLGYGAIGRAFLDLLLRHVRVSEVLVVDRDPAVGAQLPDGIFFDCRKVTKESYRDVLCGFLRKSAGDVLVDLSCDVDTVALLRLCQELRALFVNASLELWEAYPEGESQEDPRGYTLYARQFALDAFRNEHRHESLPTAVLTHGANPGWVSYYVKRGLAEMFADLRDNGRLSESEVAHGEKLLRGRRYPELSELLKVRVIHIAEKDTQIAADPKPPGVFRNTWSCQGIIEEGLAPAELGWGTHETASGPLIFFHQKGERNQVCLASRGINTVAVSCVPSGAYAGLVIRHEESFSISQHLTVWDGDRASYRPSVYYVYGCCPDVQASFSEFQSNDLNELRWRVMNEEIIRGVDELGVLLIGEHGSWWRGSILDIDEARAALPGHSATTIQVAVAVLAGMLYAVARPNEGPVHSDDMDEEAPELLPVIDAYLGEIFSGWLEWSPAGRHGFYFGHKFDDDHPFDLRNFLITPIIL
ncbi:MAG: saccharopine dehydrogenase NADP-binding domain-containing protein [Sulfobacillus sp.]